jgi:hypothetical protein
MAAASFGADETGGTVVGLGSSSKFGGMVRAGFELGHFRLGVEYNLIPSTKITGDDGAGGTYSVTAKNSYLGFKAGFFFGGGRKK